MSEVTPDVVVEEEPQERPFCVYADRNHKRRGTHVLELQGQGGFVVCGEHKKKLLDKHKDVRCQHCGVPIKGTFKKAIPGFEHQAGCPRSDFERLEVG